MTTFEDTGDKQQQDSRNHTNNSTTNPYLAVKQKLRPAGSEKLQQQHKHQYEAIKASAASASSNEPFSLGCYSLSSGRSRRGKNSSSNNSNSGYYKQRSKKSLWKRLLNALYSLVYTVFLHTLLWAVAFAIGFHLPAVSFLQDFGNKETSLLVVQASSAILLSVVFTATCQQSTKRSGTSGGSYRSLDASDPTAEYINVRERLRKSSMTLKQQQQQQQQERRSSGSSRYGTKETKTSILMRFFLFLYSCLSFISVVATCAAIGFYCHDHHDDYYMIWTVTTAFALTLWFQQRLALIWQSAFIIGYYFDHEINNTLASLVYIPEHPLMQQAVMVLTVGCSVLLPTFVALAVFRQRDDNQIKSSIRVLQTRKTNNRRSIWTRFATWGTAAPRTTAAIAAASPSAADYDDNPNDPYSQVRQRLRKSPTNNSCPTPAMQATQATASPAYTGIRQKLHHVDAPDMAVEIVTSPVVKAHAAPAKAKEASRDLGLEKTMQLLLEQKSRLDTTGKIVTTLTDEEIAAANAKRCLLKISPVASKGMEGSRDLKLEETMRIFEEQKSLLKKLEEEESQEYHPTMNANNMDIGSSGGSSNIIKTSPVPTKALEAARDLKLEETMRICLEQKGRLKKRGDPTKQQN